MLKICRFWPLLPLLMFTNNRAFAADNFKRFEFQPFAGYSVAGDIPLEDDEGVRHGSVDVKSSYNIGATFAVNLNEFDSIELRWQRQFGEGRLPEEFVQPLSSGNPLVFNLNIDQYHCNFLHQYEIAGTRAMPYVMASVGVTTFRASRSGEGGSSSYFSFAIGGGVKYYFTEHFGIRGEARWNPTVMSASDSRFWCRVGGAGAACVVNLKLSLQDQLDMTGGLIFRF